MKNDQYFPLEVNLTSDERVASLIGELGVKGFGIYILLLMEMRKNDRYMCGKSALKLFVRTNNVKMKMLERVVNDFNLFEWVDDEEQMALSSEYMLRVMLPLDEKRRKLSDAAKKGVDKRRRNSDGSFASQAPAEEESKEEKSKETTTAVAVVGDDDGELKPLKGWEIILEEAMRDRWWVEQLAIHSGLGQLFLGYETEIVAAFRAHVVLQGGGNEIHSQRNLRSYFANYLRPGTPTHKRLEQQLRARREYAGAGTANPHETIDPATGQRSYFGQPIPPYAPPRPNANAYWDDNLGEWI